MTTSEALRPRDRLLSVAGGIFYREGIHAIGVDRLVKDAGVTRATFYRHFPGKDDLVLAYIRAEDEAIRELFTALHSGTNDPEKLLDLTLTAIASDVREHHTRGCPFINAAAEYPDPEHPVRQAVSAHRAWFADTLAKVLKNAGRTQPKQKARALVLLRDAALVGGYLDGPRSVVTTFLDTARQVTAIG